MAQYCRLAVSPDEWDQVLPTSRIRGAYIGIPIMLWVVPVRGGAHTVAHAQYT